MNVRIYDQTPCQLGEGPLWHPTRQELFWFDIMANKLYRRHGDQVQDWQFSENVSAAGWLDADTLLVASAAALLRFDITTGTHEVVQSLEADNPLTRSNDGRADPWGGFWIGTMGRNAEPEAGATYRYFPGALRPLVAPRTAPHATRKPNRTAGWPMPLRTRSRRPRTGSPYISTPIETQRRNRRCGDQRHVPAPPAIAAIGPTSRHELLSPERNSAVTTMTCSNVDFD